MKIGEISGPVKSENNVIVFQLKEKKEFSPAEFAKDKDSNSRTAFFNESKIHFSGLSGDVAQEIRKRNLD